MKKTLLLISLVMTILLTGCFANPTTIVENAIKKMNELDSYHMTMDMKMEYLVDGAGMSISAAVESDVDMKSKVMVNVATANFMGFTSTETSYSKMLDNETITYTKEDDVWYYTNEANQMFDYNVVSGFEKVEEVQGEKGTYKLSLTEKQINEILASLEDIEDYNIDVNNVDFKLTVKDGYVSKMVVSIPMTFEEDGQTATVNTTLTIDFSKYNEVTATIPEEVTANAKDGKILEIQTYVEDYISEIEWYVEEPNLESYTNTELEYEGPKPTKVDVSIEEYYVIDGTIEIDGYRATIVDGLVENIAKIN